MKRARLTGLILGAGVILLSAATASNPSDPARKMRKGRPHSVRVHTSEVSPSDEVSRRGAGDRPVSKGEEGAVAPGPVAGTTEALQSWILALPDGEFTALVGTERLDQYVDRIIDEIDGRNLDPQAAELEIDSFLICLNARIEAVTGAVRH